MAIARDEQAGQAFGVADDFASKGSEQTPASRRGRPRKQADDRLVRRTVLVDPSDLIRLRELYNAKSDAEAVRMAIRAALTVAALDDLLAWNAQHGGPDDVYERTTGKSRLPVQVKPGDISPDELAAFWEGDATPTG